MENLKYCFKCGKKLKEIVLESGEKIMYCKRCKLYMPKEFQKSNLDNETKVEMFEKFIKNNFMLDTMKDKRGMDIFWRWNSGVDNVFQMHKYKRGFKKYLIDLMRDDDPELIRDSKQKNKQDVNRDL